MREQNKGKAPTHRLVRWAPSFCRFAAREQNTHDKKRELNERYELSSAPIQQKKRSTIRRLWSACFVLRAGVEPAQVSLSVFETDASTDSAIGANHTEKNSNRKNVLASLNLILLQR